MSAKKNKKRKISFRFCCSIQKSLTDLYVTIIVNSHLSYFTYNRGGIPIRKKTDTTFWLQLRLNNINTSNKWCLISLIPDYHDNHKGYSYTNLQIQMTKYCPQSFSHRSPNTPWNATVYMRGDNDWTLPVS